MVYNTSGYLIGDTHWRQDVALQDGDELELDKGVLVQVGELTDKKTPDLGQLRGKTLARSQEGSSLKPISQPRLSGKPKSLNDILGMGRAPIGRSSLPKKSPYELRKESLTPSPALKSRTEKSQRCMDNWVATKQSTPGSEPHPVYDSNPSADQENRPNSSSHVKEATDDRSSRTLLASNSDETALSSVQNNALSRPKNSIQSREKSQRSQMAAVTKPRFEDSTAPHQRLRGMPDPITTVQVSEDFHDNHHKDNKDVLNPTKAPSYLIPETVTTKPHDVPDSATKCTSICSSNALVAKNVVPQLSEHRLRNDLLEESMPVPSNVSTRSASMKPAMATLHMSNERPRKKLMFLDILSTAKTKSSKCTSETHSKKRTLDDVEPLNQFQPACPLKSNQAALNHQLEVQPQMSTIQSVRPIRRFSMPSGSSEQRTAETDCTAGKQDAPEASDLDAQQLPGRCVESPAQHSNTSLVKAAGLDTMLSSKADEGVTALSEKFSENAAPSLSSFPPSPTSSRSFEEEGDPCEVATGTTSQCLPGDHIETAINRTGDFSQSSPARYFAQLRSRSLAIQQESLLESRQPPSEASPTCSKSELSRSRSPSSIESEVDMPALQPNEVDVSVPGSSPIKQHSYEATSVLVAEQPTEIETRLRHEANHVVPQDMSVRHTDEDVMGAWTIEAACLFDYWPAGRPKPMNIEKLL